MRHGSETEAQGSPLLLVKQVLVEVAKQKGDEEHC